MPQPLIELGGDFYGPPLHIAVANGFPPETYIPLLRPFMDCYRVISLPPRALWGNQSPPDGWQDWAQLGADLLAGLQKRHLEDIIAVGHSFGGVASLLAVLDEPERFKALILLDPTIFPPSVVESLRIARERGEADQHPLSQKARRRRSHFDNIAQFHAYLREKPLFRDWDDEVLRYYAEYGVMPSASGGLQLRWTPEWEAHYFSGVRLQIWEDVPGLKGLLPVLVIQGETSVVYSDESAKLLQRFLPDAAHRIIPGHGHLFPHSAPRMTSRLIMDWLVKNLNRA